MKNQNRLNRKKGKSNPFIIKPSTTNSINIGLIKVQKVLSYTKINKEYLKTILIKRDKA